MSTNFDLGPSAKTVDGLLAVPIDIQSISATLVFDAALDGGAGGGTGDATLQFISGPQAGHAVFDLRQTITAAWLDGTPIAPALLGWHDFGGGADAQMRVVQSLLAPGTPHTLRVQYTLATPQASSAGSYQPRLTWSAGPRLAFNFGFTDLGGGRYLEAWVPANLIHDQHSLQLTLEVRGTAIAHQPITNGTVNLLGPQRWRIDFPPHFSALSPLLELRAADTLQSLFDTVHLPSSGIDLHIEAWKLNSNPAPLAIAVADLKTWLPANDSAIGPYLHGSRFVCFLNVGGMEYEGGTTSGAGSLQHESFHSWWARGLKPASQSDGWWDEAWTVFNVDTPPQAVPLDFTQPPQTLASRNLWSRATAANAYGGGDRVFEGIAAVMGTPQLLQAMSALYKGHDRRPMRSTEIEEHLLCRSGRPEVVDIFHRFVFGLPDPTRTPDLWLRDAPADTGAEPSSGAFWDSPDLWVRHANDGGSAHQAPEFGQDNWFHARVRNRGSQKVRHFVIAFNVKTYAGTEFSWPGDFLPCIAAASGFDLAPGASQVLVARWPKAFVPPPGAHACWLAAVLTRGERPATARVWQSNNLGQKNLSIVDLKPNAWIVLPFVVEQRRGVSALLLELQRPLGADALRVSLVHPDGSPFGDAAGQRDAGVAQAAPPRHARHDATRDSAYQGEALDCGSGHIAPPPADPRALWTSDAAATSRHSRGFDTAIELPFATGRSARLPLTLKSDTPVRLGLKVQAPAGALPGSVIDLQLVQRESRHDRALGGLAVQLRIR